MGLLDGSNPDFSEVSTGIAYGAASGLPPGVYKNYNYYFSMNVPWSYSEDSCLSFFLQKFHSFSGFILEFLQVIHSSRVGCGIKPGVNPRLSAEVQGFQSSIFLWGFTRNFPAISPGILAKVSPKYSSDIFLGISYEFLPGFI